MRPLLVLLLLAAALVGLFFALNQGDTDTGDGIDPGLEAPQVDTPDGPKIDAPDDNQGGDEVVRTHILPTAPEAGPGIANRLFGTVVNSKDAGISDARVVLTRFGSTNLVFQDQVDRSSDIEMQTDELGKYMFENIKPFEQYALVITHPDYAQTEASQIAVGAEGDYPHYAIVMSDGSRVWGHVRDTGGAAVSRATISLASTDLGLGAGPAADTITAITDDQGLYEFKHAAPRNYVLEVTADGFGRVTQRQFHVTGRSPIQRNIELKPAVMIGGRVVASGEAPVVGATVQAYSTTTARGNQSRSQVETMADGEFFFEDLPEGQYTLLVKSEGYKPERVQRVEAGDLSVIVELRPLPMIKGHVVDGSTGKPVRNFTVRLRQEVAIQGMGKSAPVSTEKVNVRGNSKGEYAIPCPKGGTYLVEAWSDRYPGCMSAPVTVTDEQTVNGIDITMKVGGKIRGRLVDSQGNAIAKGRIVTHDNDWSDDAFMISMADMWPTVATTRTVISDSEGEFVINALTPTVYQIEVKHGQYSGTYKKSIKVQEGDETNVGKIILASGGTVRGTVYDPSGAPLPGSIVQLTADGMNEFPVTYSAKTNGEGKYVANHVKPGAYTIRAMGSASGADSNPFQQMADMKRTSETIAVFESQEVIKDFQLARPEPNMKTDARGNTKGGRGATKPGGKGTKPRAGSGTEKGGGGKGGR